MLSHKHKCQQAKNASKGGFDMLRRTLFATIGVVVTGLAIIKPAGTQEDAPEPRSYTLATATTGGTYYPVGVALATLTKVKLEPDTGISLSAVSSAGSGENVELLRDDQAQFAIMAALFGDYAVNGTGPLASIGPQDWLRSMTMLWQDVEHFLVLAEHVDSGTIDDLRNLEGRPFSIGQKNSGTEGSGRRILANLGFDPEMFELVHEGYGPTAEGLQDGTIEGANMPGGLPVSAVSQAFASIGPQGLAVLNFTDEQLEKANGDSNLWTRYSIEIGTYPGQSKPIETMAQPNFLAVHKDVPEDVVYEITRAVYDNLPFLNNIHAATEAMSLDRALAGLPAPLHPGALRFFEEQGIEIPAEIAGG